MVLTPHDAFNSIIPSPEAVESWVSPRLSLSLSLFVPSAWGSSEESVNSAQLPERDETHSLRGSGEEVAERERRTFQVRFTLVRVNPSLSSHFRVLFV